jgi:hypothetical protein
VRDIRADLKERLTGAEAKRAQFTAALKTLDIEVDALMRLIQIEDQRDNGGSAKPKNGLPLADFIVAMTEHSPMNKEELKAAAQANGYDTDGRAIHAHVTNLSRTGILVKGANETYRPAAIQTPG